MATVYGISAGSGNAELDNLRRLMAERLPDHREAIKAKLNGLGTHSVKDLELDKYKEFSDFLKTLKPN